MILFLLLLFGFQGLAVWAVTLRGEDRSRSRWWAVPAAVPGVGWFAMAVMYSLPPRAWCRPCGRWISWNAEQCPHCGGPLDASQPRFAAPNQRYVGLGFAFGGVVFSLMLTVILMLVRMEHWENWTSWEYQAVQARLMQDPRVEAVLGHPLRFGVPEIKRSSDGRTWWGTVETTVSGPRGEGAVDCGFVTCREHGLHFRRLEVTPRQGGPLRFGDQHRGPYVASLGSLVEATQDNHNPDHWTMVILARLGRDQEVVEALGEPIAYQGPPRVRPEGPGRWSFEATLAGAERRGVVKGVLETRDLTFAFPELSLQVARQAEDVALAVDPHLPGAGPGIGGPVADLGAVMASLFHGTLPYLGDALMVAITIAICVFNEKRRGRRQAEVDAGLLLTAEQWRRGRTLVEAMTRDGWRAIEVAFSKGGRLAALQAIGEALPDISPLECNAVLKVILTRQFTHPALIDPQAAGPHPVPSGPRGEVPR